MIQASTRARPADQTCGERPLRALFVIPSLRMGGAERVFATLLNEFAGTGIELHLAVLQREGLFFSTLSPRVAVHDLAVRRSIHSLNPLRRLIAQLCPDVVLATSLRMNLVVTLLQPLLPPGTRVVIREVTPLDALLGTGLRASCIRALARFGYRRAHAIVCQSSSLEADLQRTCGLALARTRVISNPVDFDEVAAKSAGGNPYAGAGPGPHVVAVGRLEPAKGVDRLIAAFPKLLHRRPHAQLWLVGDGSEAADLAALAESLGIRERLHFAGLQSNPYPWMKRADLLVLPSRREGTSNTLLEAIACKCPIVVLDHPGGTRDVMRLTRQAWRIVDDLSAWNDAWFERPSAEVHACAREHFGLDTIVENYRQVLVGTFPIRNAA
jgi:glycosyltransferase involved in cell wall biosynthesis